MKTLRILSIIMALNFSTLLFTGCSITRELYQNIKRTTTTDKSPNEEKYVGQEKDGKRHGQGTATYSSGAEYIGQWKGGNRHGWGKYIDPSGSMYGRWENDRFVGR
jgi:hypothetical protein